MNLLTNNGKHICKKNNLIFLFFDDDTYIKQESSLREFAHTKELSGVETANRNWLQPKFLTLYSLITPMGPIRPCLFTHAMLVFSLALVDTHAMLVLHRSQLTPAHWLFSGNLWVDFTYSRMYLPTTSARFIAGQVIYYTSMNLSQKDSLWSRNILTLL